MEIWKDVEAYPGYQVSSLGRVRTVEGEILKTYIRDPYNCVYLRKPYKHIENIHRLVALAFIPNPENKRTVNHIDGDTHNNSIENLEWATQSENLKHFYTAPCFAERSALARKAVIDSHTGHPVSEETRKKLHDANFGRALSLEHRRKLSEAKKGKPGTNAGTIWITDGINRKLIHESELQSYLASGYVRGRKIKNKEDIVYV